MPCNAYGHPSTCECGWGGINHDTVWPNQSPDWSRASSHTIPNARCPVCQNKVYFYRSPDGGGVFFDALGPPWPKHLCTDKNFRRLIPKEVNESLTILSSGNSVVKKKYSKYRKKTPQWWPYPCEASEALPNNEGTCLNGGDSKRLFIQTHTHNIPAHTPIWIRPSLDMKSKYDVSTFTVKNGNPVMVSYVGYNEEGISNPVMLKNFQITRKEIFSAQKNS